MYKDANRKPVKNNTFYRVKGREDYKVIFVGNIKNQRKLPKEQRLQPNAFRSYIPIDKPKEYAENLESQAHDLSRAARLIRNYLEAKLISPNLTFEFGWD